MGDDSLLEGLPDDDPGGKADTIQEGNLHRGGLPYSIAPSAGALEAQNALLLEVLVDVALFAAVAHATSKLYLSNNTKTLFSSTESLLSLRQIHWKSTHFQAQVL